VVHVEEVWLQLQHLFELIDYLHLFSNEIVTEDTIALTKDKSVWFFPQYNLSEEKLHGYLVKYRNLNHSYPFEQFKRVIKLNFPRQL
jgi:hypothetical protein